MSIFPVSTSMPTCSRLRCIRAMTASESSTVTSSLRWTLALASAIRTRDSSCRAVMLTAEASPPSMEAVRILT